VTRKPPDYIKQMFFEEEELGLNPTNVDLGGFGT
jgi:hypothetical protein